MILKKVAKMLATFFSWFTSLYPSKFDVTDIVSTDWLKFRRKYIVFRRNSTDYCKRYQLRPSVLIISSNFIALSKSPNSRSCIWRKSIVPFSYHFIFCVLAKNKMKRKRHLLDNQINVNLLTKIYFSVIFLLAIKLKSICNLHEHLSSLFWFRP